VKVDKLCSYDDICIVNGSDQQVMGRPVVWLNMRPYLSHLSPVSTPKEHFALARTQLVHARICENWTGLSDDGAAELFGLISGLSSNARIRPTPGPS